mgnify:CR=1 FL=1
MDLAMNHRLSRFILGLLAAAASLRAAPARADDHPCASDRDCDRGAICIDSQCEPGCNSDRDCERGDICRGRQCASARPPESNAPPGEAPPPELRSMRGLWIAGACVLGATYISTLAGTSVGLSADDSEYDSYYTSSSAKAAEEEEDNDILGITAIPIVGPFISSSMVDDKVGTRLLILSGVVQVAALSMLITGLVIKRPVDEPVANAALDEPASGGSPPVWSVTPWATGDTAGATFQLTGF